MLQFILLVLLVILGFALYGFIEAIRRLTGVSKSPKRRQSFDRELSADAAATCRMLDRLYRLDAISFEQYTRLRDAMEGRFPSVVFPLRLSSGRDAGAKKTPPLEASAPQRSDVITATSVDEDQSLSTSAVVGARPDSSPSISSESLPEPSKSPASPVVAQSPFDLPDQPPRPPARPWSDLLAGFMQEKNIRWGELASGILIVGSAVGLVVSLREQLRETIPYFPALLFMLITGAIHGAGAYTLNRWKLRNTSRGVLIIGLLLVPLNFLAACILTGSGDQQRALTDPVYWIAIVVGISSFSVMTWFSSKYLLRRGNLPLFIAIMGCSVTLLFINRVDNALSQSWLTIALCLPITISFAIGVTTVDRRQWTRTRWSDRCVHRMLLHLGISAFALVVAVSLLVVRANSPWHTSLALSPALAVLAGMSAWLGVIIQQGARGKESESLQIVGTSLLVLGLIVVAGLLAATVVNPVLQVAVCLVSGLLLAGLSWHRLPYGWPAVWACLAIAVLVGFNLLIGNFQFDVWTSLPEVREALVSGSSGLCLLATGAFVAAMQLVLRPKGEVDAGALAWRLGLISGGAIAAAGCGLALVASFVDRSEPFDMHVATALLGVAACVTAALVVAKPNQQLATGAALTALAFLAHLLLWNQFLAARLVGLMMGIDARWQSGTALLGLACAVYAAMVRCRNSPSIPDAARTTNDWPFSRVVQDLSAWSGTASSIAVIGLVLLIPHHTGVATILSAVIALSTLLVAWSYRNPASATGFSLATALVVATAIAEAALGREWISDLATTRHWLIQLIALSGWVIAWILFANYSASLTSLNWLLLGKPRVERWFIYALTAVFVTVLGAGLAPLVRDELARSYTPDRTELIWLGDLTGILTVTLGSLLIATVVSLLAKPNASPAAILIVLWLSGWGVAALPHEPTKAVGSALRWLLPLGGVVLALLVGSRHWFSKPWHATRERLKFSDSAVWQANDIQQLINLALTLVVLVVLVISTLVAAVFMLQGGSALGGPLEASILGKQRMLPEISFGVPVAVIVGTFLFYAATERRSWLATCGSAVFQYMVVMAIVLLFLSPNPALATKRFLNIVQAVSIGMSLYGLVWFYFRHRIGKGALIKDSTWSQLDLHTAMNGLLVASLAVLLMQRFFLRPDQPAGWINEAGGPLGFIALVMVAILSVIVWHEQVVRYRVCFVCGIGLPLAAFLASVVDGSSWRQPWFAFRVLTCGATAVVVGPFAWMATARVSDRFAKPPDRNWLVYLPLLSSGAVAVAFTVRGTWSDSIGFWIHMICFGLLLLAVVAYGLLYRSAWASAIAGALVPVAAGLLVAFNPNGWFARDNAAWLNVTFLGLATLATAWIGCYLSERSALRRATFNSATAMPAAGVPLLGRRFMLMPNVVAIAATTWIFLGALIESVTAPRNHVLISPSGVLAALLTAGLLIVQMWNDRGRCLVAARYLFCLGIAVLCVTLAVNQFPDRLLWNTFACACVVMGWGYVWAKGLELRLIGRRLRLPRFAASRRALQRHLPGYDLFVIGVVMLIVIGAVFWEEQRLLRYLAAATPLPLALGIGPISDNRSRRWLQLLTIALTTIAAIFVAWADLSPSRANLLAIPARTLLVLGAAVFAYGWFLPRKLGSTSRWIVSVREATFGTSVCALICFAVLVTFQSQQFQPDIGSGMPLSTASAVTLVILAMMAGLLAIAVMPQHDPLSLNIEYRTAYVYAAQVVGAMLIGHLYFSMPFLFQIGIKQYWPYIAMIMAFGGVGLANLLKQRELEVLGQPIFHSAAVLPVVASCAFWAIDSKADAALVMLLAGMAYLIISLTQASLLSGVAAVAFGNLALWLFYDKFPVLDFFRHPQLWLIPPAISVLVAGHLHRQRLTASQQATLRYTCAAVIYLSSTSEIFIAGLGDRLWPPMVLALLAVGGMFAGIMLQVRAYLYLGSLFLLMAVISMVSHAHQRLDHVWPWWAFGIGLGVAILVMFGLFEKRGNELRAISGRLSEWEY